MKGISVVICCFNSAARIKETLLHIYNQKVPSNICWEVIVVDNNSTDNTSEIVTDFWSSFSEKVPLKLLKEPVPGVFFARQLGIYQALYDFVLFCDDDNWLSCDYIVTAYTTALKTVGRGFALWGGCSSPIFEKNIVPPEWFEKEKGSYAIGCQGEKEGDVTARGYLWGAGSIFLKSSLVKAIDPRFPFLLHGRKENELFAGEDSEIALRILLQGKKIYFTPLLQMQHFIPTSRLSDDYLMRLVDGLKRANVLIQKYYNFWFLHVRRPWYKRILTQGIIVFKYLLFVFHLMNLDAGENEMINVLFLRENNWDSDYTFIEQYWKYIR